MTVQELRRMLAPMYGKSHVVFCQNPGAGAPLLEVLGVVETKVDVAKRDNPEARERIDAVVLVGGG